MHRLKLKLYPKYLRYRYPEAKRHTQTNSGKESITLKASVYLTLIHTHIVNNAQFYIMYVHMYVYMYIREIKGQKDGLQGKRYNPRWGIDSIM